MKPFIQDFRRFITRPTDTGGRFSVLRMWEIYSWISLSAIFLGIVIQIIVWVYDIPLNNSVQDFVLEASPLQVIFLAVVSAPIVEEILFRLPITTKKWMWILWLILLPGIFWMFGFFTSLIAIGLLGVITGVSIWLLVQSQDRFQAIVSKIFPALVFGTSILFGVIHLTNYEDLPLLSGGFLIFILPQVIIGFFLAYTRVRLGFLAAILMHALHNGVLVAMSLLALPAFQLIDGGSFEQLTQTEQLQIISSNILALIYFICIVSGVIWTIVDQWKRS